MEKTKKGTFKIYGIDWPIFLLIGVVMIAVTYLDILPSGMVGAFPLMIIIGAILNEFGNRCPIINSYFGGGAVAIIFGAAAFCYFKIIPEGAIETMTTFMKGGGFLDFYIAALITGSVLGMNRTLLIRAAIRYLPAILGGVICALGLVSLVGAITGYGALRAMLYIGVPIMGGGMGAGAVPLATIFGDAMGESPDSILSLMIPAVALGNAMAIVFGGLLNRLGKSKPSLTGNGQMLVSDAANADAQKEANDDANSGNNNFKLTDLGIGLLVSNAFMAWGNIIYHFVPDIHYYAWMILTVAILKMAGLVPAFIEKACFQWFQFVMKNLTIVLLMGIGIAYTDLGQIISAFTPIYLLLVFVVVFGAVVGSGIMGRLVGFFPIESAITAGLCMANMGGTGDVAVLSAADRMELMPFSQISSRIGGAFMLVFASVVLRMIL